MTPQRGPIMAIGGTSDKLSPLPHPFLALAGGPQARIVVLSTAEEEGLAHVLAFQHHGAQAELVLLRERSDALNPALEQTIHAASAVFLTGSKQLRLTSILGGTPLARAIRQGNSQGIAIGGINAGASLLAEHMVAYGRKGSVLSASFAPGLGLTDLLFLDQHFSHHQNFLQLMAAVAQNPSLLGLGLDEDTAVVLDHNNILSIMGQRSVIVVDGSELSYTDLHSSPPHQPLAMLGFRLHVLTQGLRYDVDRRRAILE